ncbi:MAG: HAMP domain-containing sensor histidine kinase [Anaerolineales bacterium]|jgi:signal transduction histidine kinase|nr:HAMP domain-containing sensor histidine kinase [Anaerolineales bacterium]
MSIQDNLEKIRPALQMRVSNSLARGADVRENFQEQLRRFLDALTQAVLSGDAAWLDPILREWAMARTQTDLEDGERNLSGLLQKILTYSFEIARESLAAEDALELLTSLMPIHLRAVEKAAALENESRVQYISNELQSAQARLVKFDKSKSNFISVAAHELKTPLTLIEGYAAMIGDLAPQENEQMHMLIQGTHNGIRRMREIVDDMIDVSQIDNHLLMLNFQPVWLNRVFNMLEADFANILARRRHTLVVKSFKGSAELLFADPERLYQALKNLVSNAIKYTPDGGKIIINGRTLPGFIEITVKDSGIGIALENQEAIFEKFGQLGDVSLHSSGKTKFKGGGPGLGLAITKGIIEAHGGSVWVESKGYDEVKCPGSIFHVLLPLRTQPNDPNLAKLFSAGGNATAQLADEF